MEERINRRKNYTGCRFGHLTVIEMLYNYGKHGESYCRCVCECGNECIKGTYGLVHYRRNPPHCGCMTEYYKEEQAEKCRKDVTGRRFGRLIVTDTIHVYKKKTMCRCQCDCGNVIETQMTYLTSGDVLSCGCLQKEMASNSNMVDFAGVCSDYGVTLLRRAYQNPHGAWVWVCRCGVCGNEFEALPAKVMNGHTTSCGCNRKSSGEILIENILARNCIPFEREKRFDDCADICPLPFDFYIQNANLLIEYQGIQHYKPLEFFGGEDAFDIRKKHDIIKENYCKANNIRLLEIPYTENNENIERMIISTIYPERLLCQS